MCIATLSRSALQEWLKLRFKLAGAILLGGQHEARADWEGGWLPKEAQHFIILFSPFRTTADVPPIILTWSCLSRTEGKYHNSIEEHFRWWVSNTYRLRSKAAYTQPHTSHCRVPSNTPHESSLPTRNRPEPHRNMIPPQAASKSKIH